VSRIKKRFEKILNNPIEIKWNELLPVLEYHGLICESPDGGSHWAVFHPNFPSNITVPVHNNRVKKIYVKKIISLIENIIEGD